MYMKNTILLTLLFTLLGATPMMAETPNETTISMAEVLAEPTLTVKDQFVRVQNGQGQELKVYDITGKEIFSATIDTADKTFSLNLKRGCYIVKVGKTARKISIQ